jgi:NOL1/NOP2/sun family putative RNA methylase
MQNTISNLPSQFLNKLRLIVTADKFMQILNAFSNYPLPTFRANTLKISANNLEKELSKLGIQTKRVEWYKDAFILLNIPQKGLTQTKFYKEGFLYLQSLSSMIPPLILYPKPGEKVLDLTAAPGSKTTQMAALMQNTGEIIANDLDTIRLDKLKNNLNIQGVTNTKLVNNPGQYIWKRYYEYFDKILLDAPCSLEGRFYLNNEKTYSDWSLVKIDKCAILQKRLLRSAIKALKPGGEIVYSTCTLSPEENELVISGAFHNFQDNIQTLPIRLPNFNFDPPITTWKKKILRPSVKNTVRIFPQEQMEGFYIAKLKKIKSLNLR